MKIGQGLLLLVGLSVAAVAASASAQPPGPDKGIGDPPEKKKRGKYEVLRIRGELTAKDEKEPALIHNGQQREGSFRKVHLHKMAPGRSYIIEMTDPQPKASDRKLDLDPYLRLEDSTGKELDFNDDIAENYNRDARIIFTPAKEDTYRIIATTCLAGKTGPYVLTVRPVVVGVVPGVLQMPIPVDIGDLTITALPAWGLNTNMGGIDSDTHGYIEYRFVIENNSETDNHAVKLRLPRDKSTMRGHFLQSLRQSVDVQAGATRYVSIFQPDLPFTGRGDAGVEIDGRLQGSVVSIGLFAGRGNRTNPSFGGGTPGQRPMILVPSDSQTLQDLRSNASKSAVGVETKRPTVGGSATTVGFYAEPGPYFNKPYTYYEIVRFQNAPLIAEGWSKHWLGYSSWDGVVLNAVDWTRLPAEAQSALTQYVECGGSLLIVGSAKLPESWERCRKDEPGFIHYFPGFGQCLVTNKINPKTKVIDVAAWDPDDWRLIFKTWEQPLAAWQQMRTPTEANKEFPVVEGLAIPVRELFIAMLVFVTLIGPVNVYWLSRTRRRIWLLWTVPVFSLFTCILLVGFMVATEGWHGHVRAEGITVLDQAEQRATTIGWAGFYSPTTPAGGLRFSTETELTPHLNSIRGRFTDTPRPCAVEWQDQQVLSEGWVVAKIPIHFMTRRSEKRIERVTLRKHDDGSLGVVNNLGADIRSIHVAAADGKIYTASDVRAGPETPLQPTALKAGNRLDKLTEAFAGHWIQWSEMIADKPEEFLRPGCYVAVIDDSPFLEPGLEQAQTRKLRSVVFGMMKNGEW